MKALIIGDVHLADKAPSSRKDTYRELILGKLAESINIANARQVDVVVQAGDLFHIKAPSRTSHKLVTDVAGILATSNAPVLIVPGNHDMQHDRLDSLPKQPLGVVGELPNVHLLVGWAEEFPIFGVPYLWDWKLSLPSYVQEYRAADVITEGQGLIVAHAPLIPPSSSLPYEVIEAEDWAKAFGEGSTTYYGHMHHHDGQFDTKTGRFCNQGALSRGSLHESSISRLPAVTIFDSATREFERVEITHLPADEVFFMAEAAAKKAQSGQLEDFLAAIGTTTLERLTVEGVLAHLDESSVPEDVKKEVRECLEAVL